MSVHTAVLLCALLWTAGRAGALAPDAAPPDVLRDDPRLEQRITFSAASIQVGDLLDRLTTKTGVPIRAEEKDGAADPVVAVFVRDLPLRNLLDSLRSLMSYKGAEWKWERDGKPGAYTYALMRPLAAAKLGARLNAHFQAAFEAEADTYAEALTLTPEQLKERAKTDPFVACQVSSPRAAAGQATFFETLTAPQQKAVLRGEQMVTVPLSALSDRGRAFVKMVWDEAVHFKVNPADGTSTPTPYPDAITFGRAWMPEEITPTLFIDLPGAGGYGYMGGAPLERLARAYGEDLWTVAGDSSTSAPEAMVVDQAEAALKETEQDRLTVQGRLRRLAKASGVSILARVPDVSPSTVTMSDQAPEHRLSDVLRNLREGRWRLSHKWRGPVLLLGFTGWFHNEASDVPWSFVKRLRESREKEGGFLSVDDLITTAARLTDSQIRTLLPEFPVLGCVIHQRRLLAGIANHSNMRVDLRSKRGAALSDLLPDGVPPNDETTRAIQNGAVYVRLDVTTTVAAREFMFIYTTRDGRPVGGFGVKCPGYVKPLDEDSPPATP